MITKWLRIGASVGDPWVLPIWGAADAAAKSGRVLPLTHELRNRGLYISIRLNILPQVVQRVNSNTSQLYEKAKKHAPGDVFNEKTAGYPLRVDNDLFYTWLADIDALLFELNSVTDQMKKLFVQLHTHVGRPIRKKQRDKEIGNVLTSGAQNTDWLDKLAKHRNFFIHEGAPDIAVDLSNEPAELDLLIMKKDVNTFSKLDTFVSLSDINSIVQGFKAAKQLWQVHLVGLFR